MVRENIQGWSLEILGGGGGGVTIAKIFKRKYEAKLEIPGEWEGSNQRTIIGRSMGIF